MLVVRAESAVTVQGLGAVDCNATRGPEHDGTCDALGTGRVGIAYAPDPAYKLSFNAGRYARVPTLGELYGLSAALSGNHLLVPETGINVDAGVAWSQSHASDAHVRSFAELFAFARYASELIAYRRTSFAAATPFNVGNARILGTELALGAEAWRALRLEVSATVLDPRDTTPTRTLDNDILPLRPRLIASPSLELFTEPTPLRGVDRASLAARAFYRSEEVADPAGLLVIGAQTTVDTELTVSFWDRMLTARLRVADIFDAPVFDIVGYPLPRRSWHASLEGEW
jgi:iron complex outermembrane receptor protein